MSTINRLALNLVNNYWSLQSNIQLSTKCFIWYLDRQVEFSVSAKHMGPFVFSTHFSVWTQGETLRLTIDVLNNVRMMFLWQTCTVVSVTLVTRVTNTYGNFTTFLAHSVWITWWRTANHSSWKRTMIENKMLSKMNWKQESKICFLWIFYILYLTCIWIMIIVAVHVFPWFKFDLSLFRTHYHTLTCPKTNGNNI